MIRLLVVVSLLLATHIASADVVAWQGYQALGILDEQVGVLSGVTVEGLRQGGIADDVYIEDQIGNCGSDVACHCGAARRRGVRYASFGSLGKLGDLWTIELTLVETHACTVAGAAYLSESIEDSRLPAQMIELGKKLTTPKETVASTAVGRERKISATPALVTTFTRSQLRALNIRNLNELLPFVPGFDVVDASWGGLVTNQGLPNSLLIMSDGIPLVNGLNNFRWLDRDYRTSMAHISKIEVVRGPGSVLWGRNAFLGVINLISEPNVRREASVDAGVTIGSLDTEELWGRFSQNRGLYTVTASIDVGRRVGPTIDVPASPPAVFGYSPALFGNGGKTSPEADLWFDTHLRLSIDKRLELIFQNQTNDTKYEISPRGPLLEPGHPGYWEKTHRLYALVGTQPVYEDEEYLVTAKASVSRYEYYSWESFAVQPAWPTPDPPTNPADMRDYTLGVRSLQGNREPRVANQAEVRGLVDFDGNFENHFTLGLNVQGIRTPNSLATVVGIDETPAVDNISFRRKHALSFSAFALEEWVPLEGFGVSAGARVQRDGVPDGINDKQWSTQASAQGGIVYAREPFGAKLVFAQGFRPPDAVSLYSTVGTKGNKDLEPERSNELAAELDVDILPELKLRIGGNITRISKQVVLQPLDPATNNGFLYTPVNRGRIDLRSGFLQLQLAASKFIDATATYHLTSLDESAPMEIADSNPRGRGIAFPQHTGSFAVVWRPMRDLTAFGRGSFASSRHLHVLTAVDPSTYRVTKPSIRTVVGVSLANAIGPLDLDLYVDNPLFLTYEAPYQVEGAVAGLVERRRATEAFATLRYEK